VERLAGGTCASQGAKGPATGEKPRAGECPRRRDTGNRVSDTLKARHRGQPLGGAGSLLATKREDPGEEGHERSRTGPARDDGRHGAKAKTWRRKSRRGERRRRRLNTNFVERIASRKKAPKSSRARVAAGQPVSAGETRARGHGLTTSRPRLRSGTKPLNGNPGRGCGMKEAHEAEGGGSRREVEKT